VKEAMKIVTLTDEEEKLVAKLRRDALKAKAGEANREVVRAENIEVIHCRDSSGAGAAITSSDWKAGEQVSLMWMPAGVHTICAGFRKGSIELTVQCDEATASAVQASLDGWREERPKQEPFGCIEHKEQEASFRVGASCGFKWNGDGVYLAAEPTTLGAQNVNGRIHRSWSPSFTTDADYGRASEQPKGSGVLVFPEGVRGSRSNPARITGVDFCVGTLTNKPAFHSMSPVKAREADAVTAAGNSEGAKKGWETKRIGHTLGSRSPDSTTGRFSQDAADASQKAEQSGDPSHHREAANLHGQAANRHYQAASKAYEHGGKDGIAQFHQLKSEQHMQATKEHMEAAKQGGTSGGFQHASDAAPSDALHAHCAAMLVQDVPDATESETAAYEAALDKGSSHAQAVQELRAARVAKLSASEPPTADSIAAAYEAAVAEANRIAAEQGAAKLTAEDVYKQVAPEPIKAEKQAATAEEILEQIYARAGANR